MTTRYLTKSRFKLGIESKNFSNMAWWQQAAVGCVRDPYKLLFNELEGDEPGVEEATSEGID